MEQRPRKGVIWIALYVKEWLVGTNCLSLEERGVLITLVGMTGDDGTPPLNDAKRLSMSMGCTKGRMVKIIDSLVDQEKVKIIDGRLVSERALWELGQSLLRQNRSSFAAKKRWEKPEKSE